MSPTKKTPAKKKPTARSTKAAAVPQSPAAKLAASLHLPTNAIIGGRSVPAASGKTFATFNPATGEELAQIARCGAEDVDRAVAAARECVLRSVEPVDAKRAQEGLSLIHI